MSLLKYYLFKYDPFVDNSPYMQVQHIDTESKRKSGILSEMLLDVLFSFEQNGISFRRSCREGICGSCAMNINGVNTLACLYRIEYNQLNFTNLSIYPLSHMAVIKDLIVCMRHFYSQYKAIDPFIGEMSINQILFVSVDLEGYELSNIAVTIDVPNTEELQTKEQRQLLDGVYECILCACCSTSCPSYWWNREKYLGPAVLLQSFRWMIDSRDDKLQERLNQVDKLYTLYRCHTILNCTQCCPKNLNPANAISNIKTLVQFFR